MKTQIILLGLIFSFIVLGSCSDDKDPIEPESLSRLENKEIVSESLKPNFMDNSELRKIQIYIPPGYDNNLSENYPVVYLLHGLPFSEKSFTDPELWVPWIGASMPFVAAPDFPEIGFRKWVDGLIEIGDIEPMIIVMPDAATNNYGFSMYTNSVLTGGFEDYIVNDLVNYIDSNYRTIDSNDGRALIGTSQGGYGADQVGYATPQ